MILVYFISGESATMPTGTHVRAETLATVGTEGAAHPGVTCLEAQGREVGRFRGAEIVGYVIAGADEADERDGVTADEFDHADMLTGADWPPRPVGAVNDSE